MGQVLNLDVHLIATCYGGKELFAFNYDQYGRLTNTANPLGQAKTYAYDAVGNRTAMATPWGKYSDLLDMGTPLMIVLLHIVQEGILHTRRVRLWLAQLLPRLSHV